MGQTTRQSGDPPVRHAFPGARRNLPVMERSDVVEIAIAVGSVGVFVAALAVVGSMYGSDGGIAADGALPLVGALVLFVVVMAAAGLYLAGQDA